MILSDTTSRSALTEKLACVRPAISQNKFVTDHNKSMDLRWVATPQVVPLSTPNTKLRSASMTKLASAPRANRACLLMAYKSCAVLTSNYRSRCSAKCWRCPTTTTRLACVDLCKIRGSACSAKIAPTRTVRRSSEPPTLSCQIRWRDQVRNSRTQKHLR